MFDSGAITARLVLDAKDFYSGVQKAQQGIRSLGEGMQKFGDRIILSIRQLQRFASAMTFLGAGISAPLIAAFKASEKQSFAVRQEIEKLTNAANAFKVSLAESLIPIVEKFNNIITNLTQKWLSLSKSTRDTIVQIIFGTGIFLLFGGIISTIILKIALLIGFIIKFGGALFAALSVPVTPIHWIIIGIGLITAAMIKWRTVATIVFNFIEQQLNVIQFAFRQVVMFVQSLLYAISKLIAFTIGALQKLPTPWKKNLNEARIFVDAFANGVQEDFDKTFKGAQKNVKKIGYLFTNEGDLAGGFENVKGKVGEVVNAFAGLTNEVDKMPKVSEVFKNKMEDLFNSFADFGTFSINILSNLFNSMETMFGDVFYDIFTGNFKDIQSAFAEFGNSLLKMASQIVARLIMFFAIIKPLSMSLGIPTSIFGFQEGTEEVPTTGVYRLHGGEKVIPRYDAGKTEAQPLTIYNMITNEAVAMAMSSKEGKGVIVNVINLDSLRNGVIRREVKTR